MTFRRSFLSTSFESSFFQAHRFLYESYLRHFTSFLDFSLSRNEFRVRRSTVLTALCPFMVIMVKTTTKIRRIVTHGSFRSNSQQPVRGGQGIFRDGFHRRALIKVDFGSTCNMLIMFTAPFY